MPSDTFQGLDQGEEATETKNNDHSEPIGIQDSTKTSVSSSAIKQAKKKKRKKEVPVIIDDPNNPMEQVAAAIQRRQLEAAAAAGPSHAAWETAVDPTSGKTYNFCRATGERKWETPESNTLPPGWQSAKDPKTGKDYFYHAATGETRWERPSS